MIFSEIGPVIHHAFSQKDRFISFYRLYVHRVRCRKTRTPPSKNRPTGTILTLYDSRCQRKIEVEISILMVFFGPSDGFNLVFRCLNVILGLKYPYTNSFRTIFIAQYPRKVPGGCKCVDSGVLSTCKRDRLFGTI